MLNLQNILEEKNCLTDILPRFKNCLTINNVIGKVYVITDFKD